MAGRPPKSTAQHKLEGTYRPTRHAARLDEATVPGIPSKPVGMDGQAGWLWGMVTDHLPPEAMSQLDTAALVGVCRWWSLWREYDQQLDDGEGNAYKTLIMAVAAWKQFEKAAAKFGLSPVDRARLKITKADGETDPMMELLKKRYGGSN